LTDEMRDSRSPVDHLVVTRGGEGSESGEGL